MKPSWTQRHRHPLLVPNWGRVMSLITPRLSPPEEKQKVAGDKNALSNAGSVITRCRACVHLIWPNADTHIRLMCKSGVIWETCVVYLHIVLYIYTYMTQKGIDLNATTKPHSAVDVCKEWWCCWGNITTSTLCGVDWGLLFKHIYDWTVIHLGSGWKCCSFNSVFTSLSY